MTEALFSLAGVVIGGLLSVVTTLWIERVRDRRAARAAARLVHEELTTIAGQLSATLTTRSGAFVRDFPAGAWREHRAVLARTLTRRQWTATLTAYKTLSAVKAMHSGIPASEAEDATQEGLRCVTVALKALGRVGSIGAEAGYPVTMPTADELTS